MRPATNQVDDLLGEIRKVAGEGGRVLVTTLTKRMAESLTSYLRELEVRVEYLHSDVERWNASNSSAPCGWASTTCWWASTCCARALTFPKYRSWPS